MSKIRFQKQFVKSVTENDPVNLNRSNQYSVANPDLTNLNDLNTIADDKNNSYTNPDVNLVNPAKFTKRLRNYLLLSLGLFALIVIAFIGAGLNVYAQSKRSEFEHLQKDCRRDLDLAQKQGLQIQNLNCNLDLGWQDFWSTDKLKQLEETRNQIQALQAEIIQKIQANQDKIRMLESDLQLLGLTDADQQDKLDQLNLDQNLVEFNQFLEDQIVLLSQKREQGLSQINEQVGLYEKTLEALGSQAEPTAATFLKDYKTLADDQKIRSYPEFKTKLEQLKQALQEVLRKVGTIPPSVNNLSFKILDAFQFQKLYEDIQYQNVSGKVGSASITGDPQADQRIVTIAERRGYRQRFLALESTLQSVDGQRLAPQALNAWQAMKAAAAKDGVKLGLISGYRSVDTQRQIFTQRLSSEGVASIGRPYTNAEIASGQADVAIDRVLQTSSIPGYSKHHTGYTIDITDLASGKDFTDFDSTQGYKWISANNYENAKKFGFIPSYPKGGTNYGPNPEAWEYVWVGVDRLLA